MEPKQRLESPSSFIFNSFFRLWISDIFPPCNAIWKLAMIRPEDRLWAGSGNLLRGGPYTWYITDFDQRRHFSVTYCNPAPIADEDLEGTEDICLAQLRRHIDDLGADVLGIRLAWFQQLLSVVDDLNYRYGIMHQDIAARNLLVDMDDNLRIFDFNFSGRISEHYNPDRDDMKGVIFTLYEIMTLDEHYRDVPHVEQDAEDLLRQEWTKHPDMKLDSEVHEFRKVLDAWVEKRRTREFKLVET